MELTSTGVIVLKKATQVQEFAISDIERFEGIYIFNCPALNDNYKVAILKQPRKNTWKLLFANADGRYQAMPYKVLEFRYTINIVVTGGNNNDQ